VFIELAEALDCPECRDGVGLVAFVGTTDRRRVISGSLGCPICEVEFPIDEGTIDFGVGASTVDVAPAPADAGRPLKSSSVALKLAALLGLGERPGMVIMLGEGLGHHAPAIARMSERVEVLAVVEESGAEERAGAGWTIDDLAAGVDPVVGLGKRWPIRSGVLDGIALEGRVDTSACEAQRCLAPGRRLVVIDPDPSDVDRLAGAGYETLAADGETWVGLRP